MEFIFVWVFLLVLAYKFGKRRGRAEAEAAAKAADASLVVDTTEEDLREGRAGVSIIGGIRPPPRKD